MRHMFFLLLLTCAPLCHSQIDTASIAKKVASAVVLIKGEGPNGTSLGSGFVVSADGKIATNLHVIKDLQRAGVQLQTGEVFDNLSVLAFDERKDLAVVQIAGFELPTLELGNSNEIEQGQAVAAFGSPRGLEGTVTSGVVSSIRDDPGGRGLKLIQTDAAVNPGNSGGPLVNAKGQVIGIVSAKLRGSENLNFAVPINYLRGMLNALQKPMTLAEMRSQTGKSDVFSSQSLPSRWKSLASGTTKIVRFDGDHLYVETVLPEEERRLGNFSVSELSKVGGAYSGTTRNQFVCQYRAWNGYQNNSCTLAGALRLRFSSPTRIEGEAESYPQNTKFDCRKCSYSKKSEWQSFVWIPE